MKKRIFKKYKTRKKGGQHYRVNYGSDIFISPNREEEIAYVPWGKDKKKIFIGGKFKDFKQEDIEKIMPNIIAHEEMHIQLQNKIGPSESSKLDNISFPVLLDDKKIINPKSAHHIDLSKTIKFNKLINNAKEEKERRALFNQFK